MKTKKWWMVGGGLAAVLAITLLFTPVEGDAPTQVQTPAPTAAASQVSQSGAAIARGCAITQTMRFDRCGHSVTRRLNAHETLIGFQFAAAKEYYPDWEIEEFSSDDVVMTRDVALYCPLHYVLAFDDAGYLALFQNRYGDGYAYLRGYDRPLNSFSDADALALQNGIGFDDKEQAKAWIDER